MAIFTLIVSLLKQSQRLFYPKKRKKLRIVSTNRKRKSFSPLLFYDAGTLTAQNRLQF
jgi:hypothetical protein